MSTIFKVYGPFKVTRKDGLINQEESSEFWKEHRKHIGKIGCYVFAIKAGKGLLPWYVGKTLNSFKAEVFNPRNINIYNQLINIKKGTPLIFLLVDPKKKGKVSRKHINQLEKYLILQAKERNRHLKNNLNSRIPGWGIRGIIRGKRGKKSEPAKVLKRCLFSD